jgi:hypothetical protein
VHEKFNFNLLEGIREKTKAPGLSLEFSEDLSPLRKEVRIRHKTAPNAFAALPIEGCDSNPHGSPSELVKRRYAGFDRSMPFQCV